MFKKVRGTGLIQSSNIYFPAAMQKSGVICPLAEAASTAVTYFPEPLCTDLNPPCWELASVKVIMRRPNYPSTYVSSIFHSLLGS